MCYQDCFKTKTKKNNQRYLVKMFRFLSAVEMTRVLEGLLRVGVGGGKAATNPHPKKRN